MRRSVSQQLRRLIDMISIPIPGERTIELQHLVLDYNGTIAQDGSLIQGVDDRLHRLSKDLALHVITADTNKSVHQACKALPIEVHVIGQENQAMAKRQFIEQLPGLAAAIGNGRNDAAMFEAAELSIAILGAEGCCTATLLKSDIAVTHIHDALDLILRPHRLQATLRH